MFKILKEQEFINLHDPPDKYLTKREKRKRHSECIKRHWSP
jgi:hypothetical protein